MFTLRFPGSRKRLERQKLQMTASTPEQLSEANKITKNRQKANIDPKVVDKELQSIKQIENLYEKHNYTNNTEITHNIQKIEEQKHLLKKAKKANKISLDTISAKLSEIQENSVTKRVKELSSKSGQFMKDAAYITGFLYSNGKAAYGLVGEGFEDIINKHPPIYLTGHESLVDKAKATLWNGARKIGVLLGTIFGGKFMDYPDPDEFKDVTSDEERFGKDNIFDKEISKISTTIKRDMLDNTNSKRLREQFNYSDSSTKQDRKQIVKRTAELFKELGELKIKEQQIINTFKQKIGVDLFWEVPEFLKVPHSKYMSNSRWTHADYKGNGKAVYDINNSDQPFVDSNNLTTGYSSKVSIWDLSLAEWIYLGLVKKDNHTISLTQSFSSYLEENPVIYNNLKDLLNIKIKIYEAEFESFYYFINYTSGGEAVLNNFDGYDSYYSNIFTLIVYKRTNQSSNFYSSEPMYPSINNNIDKIITKIDEMDNVPIDAVNALTRFDNGFVRLIDSVRKKGSTTNNSNLFNSILSNFSEQKENNSFDIKFEGSLDIFELNEHNELKSQDNTIPSFDNKNKKTYSNLKIETKQTELHSKNKMNQKEINTIPNTYSNNPFEMDTEIELDATVHDSTNTALIIYEQNVTKESYEDSVTTR